MKIIRDLEELTPDLRRGAVTIGNFDGVHQGHARIIERLRSRARDAGGPALVFTFDPHPVRLLRPDAAPPPLTWTDRKGELLAELGVDAMIAYPTDEALLALTPEEFFQSIICERLAAQAVVEGPNFFFGKKRGGNIDLLRTFCEKSNVILEVVEPLVSDEQYVSSSRVRVLIQDGDVQKASELLTKPYRIRGMVTHGAGRGSKIGFATANVSAIDTLLPGVGVYAGRALVGRDTWPAAINIGPNPTFGEHAFKVEVHLIDFHGNLYGLPLEVDFYCRLRDIHPFASVGALVEQLHKDVEAAKKVAQSHSPLTDVN